VRKIHEPSSRSVLEGHGEPIVHGALISTRSLDGDDLELKEFDRIRGPVVARADVRLELVRPDDVALLASEGKTPGVVDCDSGGPDVLASFTDVIDGAVMIFAAALEGERASSGARWTIWQLGSPRGEDAARETTFLALLAIPSLAPGARCPAAGSGFPAPWAPPKAGSSLAMATSSAIRARHPSRPSSVG
jgi:hypothetical protein